MPESDDIRPDVAESAKRGWPRPSWRRIGEFVLHVIELQRTVKSLELQTKEQQNEIRRLQRAVDEQAGQLKAVMSFINTSLQNQMETKAERAAMRLFERLVDLRSDPSDTER